MQWESSLIIAAQSYSRCTAQTYAGDQNQIYANVIRPLILSRKAVYIKAIDWAA